MHFDVDTYYWLFGATAQSFAALLALIWIAFIRYLDFMYSEIRFHQDQFTNITKFLRMKILINADEKAFDAAKEEKSHDCQPIYDAENGSVDTDTEERLLGELTEHRTKWKRAKNNIPKACKRMKRIAWSHASLIFFSLAFLFLPPWLAVLQMPWSVIMPFIFIVSIGISLGFDVYMILKTVNTVDIKFGYSPQAT